MFMIAAILRRLAGDAKGNVGVIFVMAATPLVFLAGAGVDYTTAVMREDQLNAVADAAALAALRPALMAQSDDSSVAQARATFNAQASTISGVSYDTSTGLTVTAGDAMTATSVKRTVNISYTAQSQNAFMNLLGSPTIQIGGSAQATGAGAPNIDFYLLLDDSPSMAIAATQDGINTMVKNTSSQGGCAFACHQSNPAHDNLGNPGGIDNYQLARNLNVTLRIDNVRLATQDLMTAASQTASSDNAKYQMAIYTFDSAVNTVQTLTSSLSGAQAAAANINVVTIPYNNYNSDEYTNFEGALSKLNTTMPAPGSGTNSNGDTPQEVLFLVTDGVDDVAVNGTRTYKINTANCTTIKNRGIRIAVLYTTYYPLPTNSWYNTYIAPFQSTIGTTLQGCASPGLFFEVATGGDISAAMTALFQKAVTTAYLSR
jgi:Flp pilus assembly protein TadG